MPETSDQTVVLRWTVEVNREDLLRNDITKLPEKWEPQDVALADRLGLIYAWGVEVEVDGPCSTCEQYGPPHDGSPCGWCGRSEQSFREDADA